MALGEFTGGAVKYWPLDNGKQPFHTLKQEQAVAVQAKHKVLLLDGRRGHEVNDFEGERYSLVLFTTGDYSSMRDGDNGVLIYPSHSTPAPYHGQPIVKTFNFAYTAIFNILGNPVTQVPLGLGSSGFPLGVQVVAGLNMDRLSIAVAG